MRSPYGNVEAADQRVARRLARQRIARGFDLEEVPRWMENLPLVAEQKARDLDEVARKSKLLIEERREAVRSGQYAKLVANYRKFAALIQEFDQTGLTEYAIHREDDLEELKQSEKRQVQGVNQLHIATSPRP